MRYFFCLLFLIYVMSCKKDPASSEEKYQPQRILNGVFILNEGNFGKINATLSYYDQQTSRVYNGVFKTANSRDLGSIAQSIAFLDSLALIVVNGSDKIEVINASTFKYQRTILLPDGSSPRTIALLGKEKAYITNLYSNNCSVLDLKSWQVVKQIPVGSNPEGIAIVDDFAYIANSGFGSGNTVSVINTDRDEVAETLTVADNPISVKAAQGNVYVLCGGSYGVDLIYPEDDTPGALYCIDAASNTILDSMLIAGHPSKLTLDETDTGYFIGSTGIVQINYLTMQVVNDTFIAGFFYGLDYDPVSQNIYLLDAKDFIQNGQLLIFDSAGAKRSEHTVGIIPGNMGFYYEQH